MKAKTYKKPMMTLKKAVEVSLGMTKKQKCNHVARRFVMDDFGD